MIAKKAGISMTVVYYWVFHELFRMDSPDMDAEVLGEMCRRWTPIVKFFQDAGTLPESFVNEAGGGASESCHNYGAVPAFFLSSYVLGVRMDGPVGEKRILVEPRLGNLDLAEGVVVTEHGPVPVCWKMAADGKSLLFNLTVPTGVRGTVHFPMLSDSPSLTINGKEWVKAGKAEKGARLEGRWIVLEDVLGPCAGEAQ